MIYSNLLLVLSVLCTSHFMRHISALNAEGIANGVIANQANFKYQVAITGKSDQHSPTQLLCSGVIVAASWILTTAHCFMETSKNVRSLLYKAVIGSADLNTSEGFIENLTYIITDNFEVKNYANDVAMVKTENVLSLGITLKKIDIAHPRDSYLGQDGIVSGYGFSKVSIEVAENGDLMLVKTNADYKLRNTTVKIMSAFECFHKFQYTYPTDKYCGLAAVIDGQNTGVCSNDVGSPLVVKNKLVALASTNYDNCDDTHSGSLYLMMSKYYYFVQDVLINNRMDSWLINILSIDFDF